MTIESRVDKARRIIISEATGALTDEDVLRYTEWVRSDPALREFDMLMDLRAVAKVEVTPEGLRESALLIPSASEAEERYRIAIVAGSDLVYGMARMYEMLREGAVGEVRIFRDMEEAKAWLWLQGGD